MNRPRWDSSDHDEFEPPPANRAGERGGIVKRIGSFLAVVASVAVTAISPAMAAKAPKNAAPKEAPKMNTATLQTTASRSSADEAIRPFHVHVSEEALTDLRRRILSTQWPDKET